MYAIEDIVAHAPPMILIDRVLDHNENAIQASVTITQDSPFLYAGVVPSYVVIEYMAQSIAAYSGILACQKEQDVQIGFLLGTRKLELKTDCFEIGDEIVIEAEALYNDGEMASFDCLAKRNDKQVAQARLNVYQPTDENSKTETKADG